MSAWVMFVVGCFFAVQGICVLNGWRAALSVRTRRGGWGAVAAGGGFAADSLPRIAGWSNTTNLTFATAGLALLVLGSTLMWRDRPARRASGEPRLTLPGR